MTPIGFTGTQLGYHAPDDSERQRGKTMFCWLVYLRERLGPIEGHHGDCDGSDKQFHGQCRALGIPRVIHPPTNEYKRAFAHRTDNGCIAKTTILDPLPFLERNRVIVDVSWMLLTTPATRAEEMRSGTWSTIRYARQARRWIVKIWPDGSWNDEGPRPEWFMGSVCCCRTGSAMICKRCADGEPSCDCDICG